MKTAALIFFLLLTGAPPVRAQTVDRDSFEVGVEAYNAGNCAEALRIMKKYEKEQPSAAYVVKVCSLMLEKQNRENGDSSAIFAKELRKGDLTRFEKLGMVARFTQEVSGISGAAYVTALTAEARKGTPKAAFQLGLLYQEGIGVPHDFKTALRWFDAAAENGHASAMNSAGFYRRYGIGTPRDNVKALELYKKSVENGNSFALYNLARLYGDGKNRLKAWLFSDLAVRRLPQDDKKKIAAAQDLRQKADKNLSTFHRAYLAKFRPFEMNAILTSDDLNGVAVPQSLPEPPENMIEETAFMKFVSKDAFDNRYKVFFPLMPSWVGLDSNGESDPALTGKALPAPSPEDADAVAALYFRPADPRYVHLTLKHEKSAVPLSVGDILTLTVLTPLFETPATRKGGHYYIQNTGYDIILHDPQSVLETAGSFVLTPLPDKENRAESWLSRKFRIRRAGTAVVRFVPRKKLPKGEKIFPHTIKIVAIKGKDPK